MRWLWITLFLAPFVAHAQSSPPPVASYCSSSAAGPWVPCASGSSGSPTNIVQTPSSNPANAITPVTSSVANETCHVLKAAPGNLYLVAVYNSVASGTDYLELFNSTTAPSNGAIVQGQAAGNMVATPIPVNALTFVSQATVGNIPTAFSTGITVCLSSTNGLTFTGVATGNFTGLVQ